MEAVKSAVAAYLLKQYGAGCVLELDTSDRCMKMELPISHDHVIYVRPDKYERSFLCHYAHKADLADDQEFEKNGEMLEWKQQNVAQLARNVKGPLRDFLKAVMWYVPQAAERIDLMEEMGGRREVVIETFKEAKARRYYCPMPKKPEVVLNKPVAVFDESKKGAKKFPQK